MLPTKMLTHLIINQLTLIGELWYFIFIQFQEAECDTKSISKRNKSNLNLELSFSKTGCLTKTEEFRMPNYLPISKKKKKWMHAFHKNISMKWNTNRLVQDLNSKLNSFPQMLTITLSCHRQYYKTQIWFFLGPLY